MEHPQSQELLIKFHWRNNDIHGRIIKQQLAEIKDIFTLNFKRSESRAINRQTFAFQRFNDS